MMGGGVFANLELYLKKEEKEDDNVMGAAPVSSANFQLFPKTEEEEEEDKKFKAKAPTFYESFMVLEERRHQMEVEGKLKSLRRKRDGYMVVDMALAARLANVKTDENLPAFYLDQKYYELDHSPNRFWRILSEEARFPSTFALRPPGKARLGEACTLKANHFLVELSNQGLPPLTKTSSSFHGYFYDAHVHLYHVSIHREKMISPLFDKSLTHLALNADQDQYKLFLEQRTNSVDGHEYCQRCCDNHPDVMPSTLVTSSVNRDVMAELVKLYKESHLWNKLPAYDGKKCLYTAGLLPFMKQEFKITLRSNDGSGGLIRTCCSREIDFKVSIKFASLVNTFRVDPRSGGEILPWTPENSPPEALKALNTVLGQFPSNQYTRVGRSFYDRCLGPILSDELCAWSGFCQSLRPTQMGLSLNIDISSTVFLEPLPVAEFIVRFLKKREGFEIALSDADHAKIEKALKGVKVEFLGRKYCISGLISQATWKLNSPADDSVTPESIPDDFKEACGFWIRHTQWPLLQVGNTQKPSYLPLEFCEIIKGQRYSKRLNNSQTTAFLKVIHQSAQERAGNILKTVRLNYDNNGDYAKEFGITINTNLTSVEARILPSPRLKYHDHGLEGDCVPQVGFWGMKNKKLVNGGSVERWTCINFAESVSVGLAHDFCHALAMKCRDMGMDFNLVPWIPVRKCHRDQLKRALEIYREKIELLLVILPDNNGSLYGDLKRICETDIGIVSQCCLRKHVVRRKDTYLSNVALKINVKVGGRNTVLVDALSRRIPIVSNAPTIIFGADVSHPQPGESSSPSIAAVVASQDWPEITKYAALVCSQAPRQELIKDLYKKWQDPIRGEVHGGMIRELLLSFYIATGYKPRRIIFYRDGVSEGQFCQVISYELEAIRQACDSLDDYYEPAVTFVMVQKRHHTRLFRDLPSMDGVGNVLPGTVVDSKICHPTQFDFYLCSHAGIQGTSRPVRYHVLWDENNFSADDMQSLTNNLCYTYARCTHSVSIVPPAYYAHLAAFRARFYMEPDDSESKISAAAAGHFDMVTALTGGKRTPVPGANAAVVRPPPPLQANVKPVMFGKSTLVPGANATAVRPLPPLHENVKRVMFYC